MEPLETAVVVPRLLTGRQVLEVLGYHVKYPRQRLLDLRNAGLPAVFLRGRFVYRAEDVLAFVQSYGSANHAAS
jgi:hypothetical protein